MIVFFFVDSKLKEEVPVVGELKLVEVLLVDDELEQAVMKASV